MIPLVTNLCSLSQIFWILVRGAKDKGDIKNTDALNEAYTFGLSL
jgi:hypothetical protein